MALKTRWIEDAARLAGGTVSVLSNIHMQMRQDIRTYIDDMATRLDYVPREDFLRLESVVNDLRDRLSAIEAGNGAAVSKSAKKNPAVKPQKKTKTISKRKPSGRAGSR